MKPTRSGPPVAIQSPDPRARWRVIHAYLVLPHAVPILVVMATTAGFIAIFAGAATAPWRIAAILLAMLAGQIAIGAVNELVDAERDAISKPSKPIPAGLVSRSSARAIAATSLLCMIVVAALLGWTPLLLCALGTGCGLAYDLWLKPTIWSWLPYFVALPLLPIWVATALGAFDARLLLLYPLGAIATLGVHLSQSLPDIAGDRAAGLVNLSSRLSERRAIALCWLAMLSAPVLALALTPLLVDRLTPVLVASLLVATLVVVDAALYLLRPRLGVLACFPCVAIATAAMGLGWVLAVQG